ncbi:MAG TPA: beta-galactosidase [Candidatus Saccharimonadales bacterium]|nr:beta-galactosidase [Candidatus Saccharimonadales bacterium]
MPKNKHKSFKNFFARLNVFLDWLGLAIPRSRWGRGLLITFASLLVVSVAGMYGIARWYIAKHSHEPLVIGATFVPDYARGFGVDPQETLDAVIKDLGIKRLRLVSYWNDGEPSPGKYDFSDLDWQFKMAEENNVQVTLALGLRQPRWPECHMPDWAASQPKDVWAKELKVYMGKVIDRYKDSPSLVSYQLENEYFLNVFGRCTDFSRDRLVDEFNFVKSKDSSKPLIVTRSNNAVPSWPIGQPRADINGASIYKRVWDKTVTNRYFEYPIPAWFYAFLAGGEELSTGHNTFIHELQAEAWLPDSTGYGKTIPKMNDVESIPEQNKSLNADNLGPRFDYGVGTGMRTMDLWGVEWWYWRKVKANDPSLWNIGKAKIAQYDGTVN